MSVLPNVLIYMLCSCYNEAMRSTVYATNHHTLKRCPAATNEPLWVNIRFAQAHERLSTKSFVVLIRGNSNSNHLGAQGTFDTINNKHTGGVE